MPNTMKRTFGTLVILAVLAAGPAFLANSAYAGPKPDVSAQAQAAKIVNINTAGSEELQTLRGVGPAIAERILQYRQENGRFQKVEDLANVRGIGGAKLEKLKSEITI